MASLRKPKAADVESAAIPAEALDHAFPKLNLPLQPPYPPAEAKSVKDLPREAGWFYEPKWDGFRCLAFRQGDEVVLQSKAGQPLGRYFLRLLPLYWLCQRANLCWMAKLSSGRAQGLISTPSCSAFILPPAASSAFRRRCLRLP